MELTRIVYAVGPAFDTIEWEKQGKHSLLNGKKLYFATDVDTGCLVTIVEM